MAPKKILAAIRSRDRLTKNIGDAAVKATTGGGTLDLIMAVGGAVNEAKAKAGGDPHQLLEWLVSLIKYACVGASDTLERNGIKPTEVRVWA